MATMATAGYSTMKAIFWSSRCHSPACEARRTPPGNLRRCYCDRTGGAAGADAGSTVAGGGGGTRCTRPGARCRGLPVGRIGRLSAQSDLAAGFCAVSRTRLTLASDFPCAGPSSSRGAGSSSSRRCSAER